MLVLTTLKAIDNHCTPELRETFVPVESLSITFLLISNATIAGSDHPQFRSIKRGRAGAYFAHRRDHCNIMIPFECNQSFNMASTLLNDGTKE